MGKVIVVVGPTAVGKTKLAIEIAKHFSCNIISGDSIAVYKGLDIGSAKPTKLEQQQVHHYLIDILDPTEQYNVADFQKNARSIIEKEELSIICGGTGLYVQSVIFDYEFQAKKRDNAFEQKYSSFSNEELYEFLLKKDPQIDKEKIHPHNRKRVLRALEVLEDTKSSIYADRKKDVSVIPHYIVYLSMPREKLYERISKRVDQMIEAGLEQEVYRLYKQNIFPHAIGYREFIPYFEGKKTLSEVTEEIKLNTRHLAKRQETWFRNQMDSHFYMVEEDMDSILERIIKDIERWLKQ